MNRFRYVLFFLAVVAVTACHKSLTGDELQYVGTWEATSNVLVITAGGHGDYYYDDGSVQKHVSGTLKITGSEIKIGGLIHKTFHIDVKPHTDTNGDQYMTLDGTEYAKD